MSMKRILMLCLALALLSSVALAEVTFTPGTYEGTGEGFGADGVKATVVLNEQGIESIAVDAASETPTIGGAAIEALIPQIVENQSLAVDAVAGATLSSNGLKAAVAAALEAAGIDPAERGYEDAKPILPPCMLLKEVDAAPNGEKLEGYRYFDYTTQGTTCSTQITFAICEADLTVHGIKVLGGCLGTADAFGALCEGQTIDYCVERMAGILCHGSKGSSCPDQTAKALAQAKVVITGEGCTNCSAAQ